MTTSKHLIACFAALAAAVALAASCGPPPPPAAPTAEPLEVPPPQDETARAFTAPPKNIAGAPRIPDPTLKPQPPDRESLTLTPRTFGRAAVVEQVRLPEVTPPALAEPHTEHRQWKELERIEVGQSHLSHIDVSRDERHLLVVSEDEGAARIYDLETKELLQTNPLPSYESFGRGDFLFWPARTGSSPPPIVVATEQSIAALDPATGQSRPLVEDRGAWHLRWSDDGKVLMANLSDVAEQTSTLRFFQVSKRTIALEPILALAFEQRVDGFDLSPNGRLLAVSYYPSDTVELLDLYDRRLLWRTLGPKFAGSVDISPDGELVAVGGKHAVLYDAKTGERLGVFEKLQNNIHRVRFSPSGDALAVTAYDGRVRILSTRFEGPTLPKLKVLRHRGISNVYEAIFTEDGARLFTSSGDQTVRIWGTSKKEQINR